MISIYVITNKLNGKQYVGKTQKTCLERFNEHARAYNYGERNYIACAMHKYGKQNFEVKLIAEVADDSWEFWEKYYIEQLHTHYSEGGYNVSRGGDSNPMDDPVVVAKHSRICKSEYFRNLQRALQTGRKHSEETKELCRKNTLSNLDVCMKGFKKYNESRKTRVGMIEDDRVVKVFESLSDAAKYACEHSDKPHKFNVGDTSQIKHYADKFNKNGKRAKFLGYAWTLKI